MVAAAPLHSVGAVAVAKSFFCFEKGLDRGSESSGFPKGHSIATAAWRGAAQAPTTTIGAKADSVGVSLLTVPLTGHRNGKIVNCLFLKTTIRTALS